MFNSLSDFGTWRCELEIEGDIKFCLSKRCTTECVKRYMCSRSEKQTVGNGAAMYSFKEVKHMTSKSRRHGKANEFDKRSSPHVVVVISRPDLFQRKGSEMLKSQWQNLAKLNH